MGHIVTELMLQNFQRNTPLEGYRPGRRVEKGVGRSTKRAFDNHRNAWNAVPGAQTIDDSLGFSLRLYHASLSLLT